VHFNEEKFSNYRNNLLPEGKEEGGRGKKKGPEGWFAGRREKRGKGKPSSRNRRRGKGEKEQGVRIVPSVQERKGGGKMFLLNSNVAARQRRGKKTCEEGGSPSCGRGGGKRKRKPSNRAQDALPREKVKTSQRKERGSRKRPSRIGKKKKRERQSIPLNETVPRIFSTGKKSKKKEEGKGDPATWDKREGGFGVITFLIGRCPKKNSPPSNISIGRGGRGEDSWWNLGGAATDQRGERKGGVARLLQLQEKRGKTGGRGGRGRTSYILYIWGGGKGEDYPQNFHLTLGGGGILRKGGVS